MVKWGDCRVAFVDRKEAEKLMNKDCSHCQENIKIAKKHNINNIVVLRGLSIHIIGLDFSHK